MGSFEERQVSNQVCKKCGKSFDPRSSVLPPIPGSIAVECPLCGSWERLPIPPDMQKVANAVFQACKRQVEKERSLDSLNLDSIVLNALKS